jgi:hypothetical protein
MRLTTTTTSHVDVPDSPPEIGQSDSRPIRVGRVQWEEAIRSARGLGPMAKLVALYLLSRMNPAGVCWPSQHLITLETEASGATINRKLNLLEDAGLLRRLPRPGRSGPRGGRPGTLYQATIPASLHAKLGAQIVTEAAPHDADLLSHGVEVSSHQGEVLSHGETRNLPEHKRTQPRGGEVKEIQALLGFELTNRDRTRGQRAIEAICGALAEAGFRPQADQLFDDWDRFEKKDSLTARILRIAGLGGSEALLKTVASSGGLGRCNDMAAVLYHRLAPVGDLGRNWLDRPTRAQIDATGPAYLR